jgi:hypothetical protein
VLAACQEPAEVQLASSRWVEVAFPPGALTLIGSPRTGGFAWAAGFRSVSAAVASLISTAFSVPEDA